MSSVISSFNYKVEASVIINNTDYKIPDGTINSIIVDYDYDIKNTILQAVIPQEKKYACYICSIKTYYRFI